jgi:hypothetical protein
MQTLPQLPGEAGVRQTINLMVSLTNASITDPLVRAQAAQAISGCPRGDRACQCYALLSWVKRIMHYVADPKGVEALHDPRLIAKAIHEKRYVYGDCDDMSMYLAALMKSVGLDPSFRAVGYGGKPYQHVYVSCLGMRMDATRDEWNFATPASFPETSVLERRV